MPEQRRRFCSGATWAKDRSSYNMYFTRFFTIGLVPDVYLRYLFGGASIDKGPGFGDVYVLSLPSFRWIKVRHRIPNTKEPNLLATNPCCTPSNHSPVLATRRRRRRRKSSPPLSQLRRNRGLANDYHGRLFPQFFNLRCRESVWTTRPLSRQR